MTKEQGMQWLKEIQNVGFDRNELEVPRGQAAERFWNEPMFVYGMEYGAILAIMKVFDITKDDLKES